MRNTAAARRAATALGIVAIASSLATTASAEITLVKTEGGWEVFTDGRVSGFGQYVKGDSTPPTTVNGHSVIIDGEAFAGIRQIPPPLNPDGTVSDGQGTLDHFRVRSGFVGNILGFGVRRHLDESTTVKAYMAIWHYIQSDDWRKYIPNTPDVREGYLRVDGQFGSVLVGRMATLFSRGATEIDFLYGHGYGAGSPAGFQTNAPSGGHVGFGVLANGFGAGIEYATPLLAGLQLTVGVFDPNQLVGATWELPRLPRGEGELTFDYALGDIGKLHLFANGAWQRVYHPQDPSKSRDVYGVGAGGRVELGPVHLGVAAHKGKGVGLNYTLESSANVASSLAPDYELRTFDGLYVQAQFIAVPQKLDLSAGWGITNEHALQSDLYPPDGGTPISVLKHQEGISAGIVYHFSNELHFDIDYFRADIEWWLGEKQVVDTVSSGLTVTW